MRGSRILAELVMSNYSVAKGILDRMVLSLMKGVRPEYLKVAIDRDLHMYRFLSEGADEAVSQLKSRLGEEEFRRVAKVVTATLGMVRLIITRFREARERFTPERVYSWLRERRPDLAEVIDEHPKGRKWLEEEIKGLRKLLFGE
ncbi:MAG: hypothetical protein DRO39_09320 [Thermoprotei archaeon]|nr:MAG: hypothetical protein DRO39_09320 [Thermoprotei archaeon]